LSIPDVTSDKIREAMGRFDIYSRESREWVGWEKKGNHKYALKSQESLYPVKEIIRLATGYSNFSGGREANSYLNKLGFDVIQLAEEEDLVFEFEESDLVEGIKGTRWRGRLAPILERQTKSILESPIKAVSVSRRTEIYIYDERFKAGFPIPKYYFAIPKFHFRLNGVDRKYEYGLVVEKGVKDGDKPEGIMDNLWSWHKLIRYLNSSNFLEEFKSIVIANGLELQMFLYGPDTEVVYRPVDDRLTRVDLPAGTSEDTTFDDFVEYISTLPENQWCDFIIRKEAEIGPYGKIQIQPVIDTYEALAPVYFSILPEDEGELVLVGATKDIRELDPHKEFLKENGKVAVWYSYPIREEYVDKLRERDTFKLLIYSKGQILYTSRVEAFESLAGSEGIESPWQDLTVPQERGKSRMGPKGSEITKTWFLVNDIAEIEPPEQLSSYVYYDSGKPIPPSALKNSFGYARKGSFMLPDERDAYAELLEKKKQIIFYGPPGTGKTYVANRVAHEFASESSIEMASPQDDELQGVLSEETLIDMAEGIKDEVFEKAEKAQPLREEFINKFPMQFLLDKKMTLEEYATGQHDSSTFCRQLEFGTKEIAGIRGRPSNKFGVYLGHDGKWKDQARKDISREEAEELFSTIRVNVAKTIEYGREGKYREIDQIKTPENMIKAKILFLYLPDSITSLMGVNVIRDVSRMLGVEFDWNYPIEANNRILRYMKSIDYFKSWSDDQIGRFLRKLLELREKGPSTDTEVEVPNALKKRIMYVTFHPAFGYEEFVEGITANVAEDESKQIGYCLREGIFKKACKYALGVALGYSESEIDEATWGDVYDNYTDAVNAGEMPDFSQKVVLVIDEINRGDIAKIFGELVTLLEADKRLGAETEIKVKLPYSNDTFGVPPNLYLIGTMNTADVSIALVDIALRRRFAFCEMMPDLEEEGALLSYHREEGSYELIAPSIEAVKVINERISREKSLGRDKQIGHSFFFKVGDENDLFLVWRYEILPLLEEYCYGDYSRINEILFADQGRDDFMDAVKGIVLEPPDLEKMIDGIRESSGID
jgi:adenylate kinase family enzyme